MMFAIPIAAILMVGYKLYDGIANPKEEKPQTQAVEKIQEERPAETR